MASAVAVEGLRDLQRAFKAADAAAQKELRAALREAAEPVRRDAELLAQGSIPRMTLPWSQMRVGVTQSLVYVAPRERGVKGRGNQRLRRPNLALLLLNRSMLPALAQNEHQVLERVDHALFTVGRVWEDV